MSQLIVADLNFCESEFPSKSEVRGGSKRGKKVSTAYDTSSGTDYKVGYSIKDGVATYTASAAAGGAAAGAASIDGKAFASTNVGTGAD